ncbi:MAG: hypothetical protein M1818_003521 [Claussenomyces sp. TS43310]|nr:MAG: hypothetical protein M1818_003521 [Claussenomyces sp. TS43310]
MPAYEAIAIRTGSDASTSEDSSTTTARARSQPRSIEDDYYSQLVNSSRRESDASDHPPSYEAALRPAARSKVQPRQDEGHEKLPEYSCSIMTRAVFAKKMELESAVHKAQDRTWAKVFVELQGTALRIFKTKSVGIFSKAQVAANVTPDLPPYVKPGMLLRTYSLQYAEVGMAADYTKRRYVIRVRAETDQFLLSCIEIETFLLWLESLSAAIDLAPPLEERKIPIDTSMPRTRRRRLQPGQNALEANTNLVRQQENIMRSHYPQLASEDTEMPEDETVPEQVASRPPLDSSGRSISTPVALLPPRTIPQSSAEPVPRSGSSPSSSEPPRATARPLPPPSQIWGPPVRMTPSDSVLRSLTTSPSGPSGPSGSHQNQSNPSISPETGKWRPTHAWSPMYDMIYAKRCVAILLAESPRKSNLVIMRGKKWIIDWATGALTRLQPPDYGEVDLVGPWGQGMGGNYGRI